MRALRKALAHCQSVGAELEDPGDEIGPEAPASKNMGIWFHEPDGYRWELSVRAASSSFELRRGNPPRLKDLNAADAG